MGRLSKKQIEELFPYSDFPIRMEWSERGDKRTAWFQCESHMLKQKVLLEKRKIKTEVRYRDKSLQTLTTSSTKPTKPRKSSSMKTKTTGDIGKLFA